MNVMEKNVMRLAAVQHLRTVYGIKIKNWNKNKATSCKTTASHLQKVFGVPLDSLPCYDMECGRVPRFLVDACMKLLAHVETEGLFRKSGSVVRLKELRAKLDAGEDCLPTARPCDVAGLVKQFFRELPEPILPTELQDAFLKVQQLPSAEERTSATMLLSCVLPDKNTCVLRHFFDFLHSVSQRSAENKMDSGNLSVILAPNLLHSGDGTEKMNANTEKRLKLQAAIVHCFIENAQNFGVLPQFLQEKVPAMMGREPGARSPSQEELEEVNLNSGIKKKNRRSFGDMVCGALSKIKTNRTPTNISQPEGLVFSSTTPVIATPSSKRKLPLEPRNSFGFSNKKRRSIKKNLGFELLPSSLFSGTSTPGSACSASGLLEDSSQNTFSPAGRTKRQPSTSARRKSKRFGHRHIVNRVESGRAGCFSPKVTKKEAPLKSLRQRFSLGKSNKDSGSGSIGLRLATQESTTGFIFNKEMDFTPSNLARKTESKSSKYISKSEDNLLTPQCDSSAHRSFPWMVETPVGTQALDRGSFTDTPLTTALKSSYMSEPAIVASKLSPANILPKKLCCASSSESLESTRFVAEPLRQNDPGVNIQSDVREPESDLPASKRGFCSSSVGESGIKLSANVPATPTSAFEVDTFCPPAQADEQNVTFGRFNFEALTPLHIDSGVFDSSPHCSPAVSKGLSPSFGRCSNSTLGSVERVPQQMNCSRLIDALDMQSPAHFTLSVSSGLQSTPYKPGVALDDEPNMPNKTETLSKSYEGVNVSPESGAKVKHQPALSPDGRQTQKRRVLDHIQHFNKLTLYSPSSSKSKQIRSPMKFQRTPVRLTVRRINSLTGESRKPAKLPELTASQTGHVTKAVSLESGLSPHPQLRPQVGRSNSTAPAKKPPPVPPKRLGTLPRKLKPCALGDMTNKVQPKLKVESDPSAAQKPIIMQQVAVENMSHYRGSPRNPLNHGQLLSATKPVDL